jgi:hypothetical protein
VYFLSVGVFVAVNTDASEAVRLTIFRTCFESQVMDAMGGGRTTAG